MKKLLQYILVFITLLGCGVKDNVASSATIYPIQLTAQLLPPYTNCLGDYMAGTMDRVNVMAVMKDMSNPSQNFDIQLRMTIRQGNSVVLRAVAKPNNDVTFSLPRDGQMKRLENAGRLLAPGQADVSYTHYATNGYCLPEGAYQFDFQAYDNKNTSLPLSEPASFTVYLGKGEPVQLLSPINNECVSNTSASINFVWTERTVMVTNANKKYRLQIFQVPDGFSGNLSQVPSLYPGSLVELNGDDVIDGKIGFKSIQNTAGRFVSGKQYVWRVQSYIDVEDDPDAGLRFENDGYSEVDSFRFDRCIDSFEEPKQEEECDDVQAPYIISVDTAGSVATVKWTAIEDDNVGKFRIEYDAKSDETGSWTKLDISKKDLLSDDKVAQGSIKDESAYDNQPIYSYVIKNLDVNITYKVRVCCLKTDMVKTDSVLCYSKKDSAEFVLSDNQSECRNEVPDLNCTTDIEETPKEGDYISANGQNVKIKTIKKDDTTTDGHTTYSGTGITYAPLLENKVGVCVEFKGIRISCANELLDGKIVTTYNEATSPNLDLNGVLNNHYTGTGAASQQETFTEASSKDDVKAGSVGYVSGTGDLYVKSADGANTEKIGSKPECASVSENGLDDGLGLIKFAPLDASKNEPPFDYNAGKFTTASILAYYSKFGSYDVPWIAMVEGRTIKIKATYSKSADDKDIKLENVYFICKTKNTAVKLNSEYDKDKNAFTLTIFGDKAKERMDIYAMYKNGDGDEACKTAKTLGKAMVLTMPHTTQTLHLVPVGVEKDAIDVNSIQSTLTSVFSPLGVDYTVGVEQKLDERVYSFEDLPSFLESFDVSSDNVFKNESANMQSLQNLYRNYSEGIDKNSAYIFVLPKAKGLDSGDEVGGIMPFSKSIGYVFLNGAATYSDGRTVAHELCHGLYSFEHAFEYGGVDKGTSPNNLMDYSNENGTELKVWQWNLLYSHKNYSIPFLSSSEDQMVVKKDNLPDNTLMKLVCDSPASRVFLQNFLKKNMRAYLSQNERISTQVNNLISFVVESVIVKGANPNSNSTFSTYKQLIKDIYQSDNRAGYLYSLMCALMYSADMNSIVFDKGEWGNQHPQRRIHIGGDSNSLSVIELKDLNGSEVSKDELRQANYWSRSLLKNEKTQNVNSSMSTLLHECVHSICPEEGKSIVDNTYYEDLATWDYENSNQNSSFSSLSKEQQSTLIKKMEKSHPDRKTLSSLGNCLWSGKLSVIINDPIERDILEKSIEYILINKRNYDSAVKIQNFFMLNFDNETFIRTSFMHSWSLLGSDSPVDNEEALLQFYSTTVNDGVSGSKPQLRINKTRELYTYPSYIDDYIVFPLIVVGADHSYNLNSKIKF